MKTTVPVWVLSSALFLLGLPSTLPAEEPLDDDAIHRFVEENLRAHRIPDLVLAITSREETLFEQGWGLGGGAALSVTTPFLIGSLSKSFTAVAILRLVEQGRIGLDDPVVSYVPDFRTAADGSETITVRHLLVQTSGLSTATGLDSFGEGQTSRQLIEGLARRRLGHRPGVAYEYSNANYWVLGRILELVSETSYADHMDREVFKPLGLERTTAVYRVAEPWGLATGHRVWFGFPVAARIPFEGGAAAAGGIVSTARDMTRVLRFHLGDGSPLLSPESMRWLHDPPSGNRYAMGWSIRKVAGEEIRGHSGAVANYQAEMLLDPEHGWGLILLANVASVFHHGAISRAAGGLGRVAAGASLGPLQGVGVATVGWVLLAGFGLWLAFTARWLHQLIGQLRGQRALPTRLLLRVTTDLATLPIVWIVLPKIAGLGLPTLLKLQPDIGWWLLAELSLKFLRGSTRLWMLRRGSGPVPSPAVPSTSSSRP